MNAPKPKQGAVTVTLIVDSHTHAGTPAAKGEQLVVDKATADWLIARKVAVASGGTVSTTAIATPSNKKESA